MKEELAFIALAFIALAFIALAFIVGFINTYI